MAAAWQSPVDDPEIHSSTPYFQDYDVLVSHEAALPLTGIEELANKTIQNIGQRPCIRRVFNIGVTYDTPPDKVQQAIAIIKELLENHEGMKPDFPPRVYFDGFKDFSLNILAIYWYHPPEYWDYMAFSEKLNLEILRRFNEAGIAFAFPTQTLHIAGDGAGPVPGESA